MVVMVSALIGIFTNYTPLHFVCVLNQLYILHHRWILQWSPQWIRASRRHKRWLMMDHCQ